MADKTPFLNEKNFSQRYVPWLTSDTELTSAVSVQRLGGYRAYSKSFNFSGINTSGSYLVENNCDAYLIIGDASIAVNQGGSGPLFSNSGIIIPPFTAGIYQINLDTFTVVALCAGIDFTSKRQYPQFFTSGPTVWPASLLFPRGGSAYVRISSLASGENPSVQPALRSGYTRTYDFYDICQFNNVSTSTGIAVAHATTAQLLSVIDSMGVKSVTFGVLTSNNNDTGNLYLSGRSNFFTDRFTFATAAITAPIAGVTINNASFALATASEAPPATFDMLISNTNAAASFNVVDAFVSLGF